VIGEIDWARVNEHRTHWPFLRDVVLTLTRELSNGCSIESFILEEARYVCYMKTILFVTMFCAMACFVGLKKSRSRSAT